MAEVTDNQTYTLDGAKIQDQIKELIDKLQKQNKACRLIVKNAEGKEILSISIAVGAIFTIFSPVLMGLGAAGALLTKCSITVTYPKKEGEEEA